MAMKVWELMAILSKCNAGDNVYVSRSESHCYQDSTSVDTQQTDCGVVIYGDGSDDDPEDE